MGYVTLHSTIFLMTLICLKLEVVLMVAELRLTSNIKHTYLVSPSNIRHIQYVLLIATFMISGIYRQFVDPFSMLLLGLTSIFPVRVYLKSYARGGISDAEAIMLSDRLIMCALAVFGLLSSMTLLQDVWNVG